MHIKEQLKKEGGLCLYDTTWVKVTTHRNERLEMKKSSQCDLGPNAWLTLERVRKKKSAWTARPHMIWTAGRYASSRATTLLSPAWVNEHWASIFTSTLQTGGSCKFYLNDFFNLTN